MLETKHYKCQENKNSFWTPFYYFFKNLYFDKKMTKYLKSIKIHPSTVAPEIMDMLIEEMLDQ